MSDQPLDPGTSRATDDRGEGGSPATTGAPRWVKLLGIIGAALLLVRHESRPFPQMISSPRVRKLALTAHIASSVGWLGAAAVFLALGVVGLTSRDAQVVRAVYVAMEAAGWVVLVPLSLASLLTGLVQALGTSWGLFRHYWVLVKLLVNVVAAVVVLLYMQTLSYLAGVAADPASTAGDLGELRSPSPVLHAGVGLVLLLVAVALSVYKPRGMTRYGQQRQREHRSRPQASVPRP